MGKRRTRMYKNKTRANTHYGGKTRNRRRTRRRIKSRRRR